jgi:hypothetical protein
MNECRGQSDLHGKPARPHGVERLSTLNDRFIFHRTFNFLSVIPIPFALTLTEFGGMTLIRSMQIEGNGHLDQSLHYERFG